MQLTDKVVLVTGGARRVGRAIALRLARAGCDIAVHYRSSTEEAQEVVAGCQRLGREAEAFQADLDDLLEAARLPQAAFERFGRLDALINNASLFEIMPIDSFSVEDWERTLRVNLTAPMVLVHAAREMLRAARGRVINLCDVSTSRPWPDHLAYMVSKGGLDTLTHVLARALAPDVNVVGIAPGVAAWPDEYDEELRQRLTKRIPLRRPGTEEDIAAAAEFLLRDGDYITGTILPVDGGRHIV